MLMNFGLKEAEDLKRRQEDYNSDEVVDWDD